MKLCQENVCLKHNFDFDLSFFLTVTEASPPKLTPVTQVSEGAQVELQCSVPVPCPSLPPSITWLLGNDPIHEQSQKQQVTYMAQV